MQHIVLNQESTDIKEYHLINNNLKFRQREKVNLPITDIPLFIASLIHQVIRQEPQKFDSVKVQ